MFDAQPTLEGAGVRLRRSLGSRALPLLDPFLLLDEIHSDCPDDYMAGFPTHPHRGFETVTYMIQGAIEHRDSLGNHGHLGPGSAQWMTAGHGIVHSEMPRAGQGPALGLSALGEPPLESQDASPRYQDIAPERIVELALGDAHVRLVAGAVAGAPVRWKASPSRRRCSTSRSGPAGTRSFRHPREHAAFAYVIGGVARIGSSRTKVASGQIAVLGGGDAVTLDAEDGTRLLLLSGKPIGEPVSRRGPFVMNTDQEIEQAIEDSRYGRLVGG